MTTTYTSAGIAKQGAGDNPNAWGDVLNTDVIELLEELSRGLAAFTCSGTVTLTADNGESNQARCAILKITGGTGGTVIIPNISKTYTVINGATGDVVISAGGATAATVESGMTTEVFCDGSTVRTLQIAGLSLREYIDAAALAATGSLPATGGNDGRALMVRSGSWTPSQVQTTDLGDYATRILGVQVALAVAL